MPPKKQMTFVDPAIIEEVVAAPVSFVWFNDADGFRTRKFFRRAIRTEDVVLCLYLRRK